MDTDFEGTDFLPLPWIFGGTIRLVVLLGPVLKSLLTWNTFSLRLCSASQFPNPADEKHHHSMMLHSKGCIHEVGFSPNVAKLCQSKKKKTFQFRS